MADFKMAYDNLVDLSAAVVTASSSAAEHAAELVQSDVRGWRWRSVGIGDAYIRVAFGAVKTFDTVILQDVNLTAEAVLMVKGSDDGVTFVPIQPGEVTTYKHPITGELTANTFAVVPIGSMVQNSNVEISISDPNNPAAYFEVGRVFVGVTFVTEPHDYDWKLVYVCNDERTSDKNGVSRTAVNAGFYRIPLGFSFQTSLTSDAVRFIRETCGNHQPLWVFLTRDEDPDRRVFYVQFDDDETEFSCIDWTLYDFALMFRTVS